jgi:hypothetical protein
MRSVQGVGRGALSLDHFSKRHADLTMHCQIIRQERILDTVQELLGDDILCWFTEWHMKEPQTEAFYSWHQVSGRVIFSFVPSS